MKNNVLPSLERAAEDLYFSRFSDKKIHVLHYSSSAPRGVVLISHGFTESCLKFREMAWYFLQQGIEPYLIDHAGHGRSYRLVKDPCLVHIDSWRTYVDDLLFVANEIKKAHPDLPLYLLGHSMGGGIAAAAACFDAALNEGSENTSARQSGHGPLFSRVILSSPMIEPLLGMPISIGGFLAGLKKLTKHYDDPIPGYHPFDGSETFEKSASLSPARFEEYLDLQKKNTFLQTCAPSMGWVGEAVKLTRYLAGNAPEQIKIPVLLFQAGRDAFVSNIAQDKFIAKVKGARKEVFPEEKHEIYRGSDAGLERYYRTIFEFLQ